MPADGCGGAQDEVRDMAKKAAAAGINVLVIDTENKFVSTGFAEEISKAAQVGASARCAPGLPWVCSRSGALQRAAPGTGSSTIPPCRALLQGKYYYLPNASDAAIAAAASSAMAAAKAQ